MTEKMNSNKLWARFVRNIGDQCSMKDWTSCSDSEVRTSLLAQQARCKGVSHLLSFVFTRAPLMISRSAISASPQYAAACRGLRFSKSCDHTIKQGLNNCAKITKSKHHIFLINLMEQCKINTAFSKGQIKGQALVFAVQSINLYTNCIK